ncbi:hypothetical protein COOONC_04995 [Cooperia oncophora]
MHMKLISSFCWNQSMKYPVVRQLIKTIKWSVQREMAMSFSPYSALTRTTSGLILLFFY